MFGNSAACSLRTLRRHLLWLGGGVLLALACNPAVYTSALARWMYNTTPSIPTGLYRLHRDAELRPLKAGDIAVYAIPTPVIDLVIERRYLDPTHAIMKPVVAVPGDHVCTDKREVIVNGTSYGAIRKADSAGRPLPWFRFCGTVTEEVIFTFTRDDRSFDSRHYGPVPREAVIARATPLWTS